MKKPKKFKSEKYKIRNKFIITTCVKKNGIEEYQKGVVKVENGKVYRQYEVYLNSVEDMGEYYYIGYSPINSMFGSFGYLRLYKNKTPEYGTIELREVA